MRKHTIKLFNNDKLSDKQKDAIVDMYWDKFQKDKNVPKDSYRPMDKRDEPAKNNSHKSTIVGE